MKYIVHYRSSLNTSENSFAVYEGNVTYDKPVLYNQLDGIKKEIVEKCNVPVKPEQIIICNIMTVPENTDDVSALTTLKEAFKLTA